MADTKDTIYVDVDDDITSIVSRVQASPKKIVALVLPKRATVFQSIVNMKLLKKAANSNDKNVVLITSEATLMPLAGVAGVHVASNLSSKPFLPPSPKTAKPSIKSDEESEIDPETPIGDVTGQPEESIEVDNSQPALPKDSSGPKNSAQKPKSSKGKKLKVPNFDKFRKKIFFAVLLGIIIIGGIIWLVILSPKATVTLKTESSEIPTSFQFSADTNADSADVQNNVVPANKQEKSVDQSEKSSASGQKDKGSKAGGVVKLSTNDVTICSASAQPVVIPAGTGVSSGNQTYITQNSATLGRQGPSCTLEANVNVLAQNKGDEYNADSRSYSITGFSNISASGGKMSGGSSKVVKIVTQADVDAAKQRIESKKDDIKNQLSDQLKKDGYIPISESFSDNTPKYNISPAVNSEGDQVTVSATIKYTMLGVKEDDLKKLVDERIKDQIKSDKQSILSEGLSSATYQIADTSKDPMQITINTTVSVGPDINQDELKSTIAGKKPKEAEELLTSRPGINEAHVKVSPGWAGKVPDKISKITIIIEDANGKTIDTTSQRP